MPHQRFQRFDCKFRVVRATRHLLPHGNILFMIMVFTPYRRIPSFNDPEKEDLVGKKPLWEMEKMLVTNIFSISQKVLYSDIDKLHHLSRTQIVVCKYF